MVRIVLPAPGTTAATAAVLDVRDTRPQAGRGHVLALLDAQSDPARDPGRQSDGRPRHAAAVAGPLR